MCNLISLSEYQTLNANYNRDQKAVAECCRGSIRPMSAESSEVIEVTVNGERREVSHGQSVLELVESLGIDSSRVAVELDRKILKRPDWPNTRLKGGEELEIVQFVGGG